MRCKGKDKTSLKKMASELPTILDDKNVEHFKVFAGKYKEENPGFMHDPFLVHQSKVALMAAAPGILVTVSKKKKVNHLKKMIKIYEDSPDREKAVRNLALYVREIQEKLFGRLEVRPKDKPYIERGMKISK